MGFVLYRFNLKENSYDEMDHSSGMCPCTDCMRHCRHWQDFRLLVRHGQHFRFGIGHRNVAEQLGGIGHLRLWFQRHIEHQPERFQQLVDHAEHRLRHQ